MSESPTDVHRRILGDYIDVGRGRGLEIGPLGKPIALRGSSAVKYVDVTDRLGLLDHYSDDPSVDPDAVPEIDYWLTGDDGTTATLAEAVADGAPFDWVIASHVVEHVPDVVGWLRDVGDILVDGGQCFLAVPDRRFCFDARRSPTTVGMALQAYDLADRIPSVRAVYDHFRTAVDIPAEVAWRGEMVGPDKSIHPFSDVLTNVARVRSGQYVDVHVWTFTPGSFVELVEDLGRLDVVDLTIRDILPTAQGQIEFYVVLDRLPRGTSPAAAETTRRRRAESARAQVPSELLSRGHQLLLDENRRREEEASQLRNELAAAQARLDRLHAQRDRLRRRLRQARLRLESTGRQPATPARPPRLGTGWIPLHARSIFGRHATRASRRARMRWRRQRPQR